MKSLLISLDMIGMMLSDLNEELNYKITEFLPLPKNPKGHSFLTLETNGVTHVIKFMGIEVWNSFVEIQLSNPSIETQMDLNTREEFEKHIRLCIGDAIKPFMSIDILDK